MITSQLSLKVVVMSALRHYVALSFALREKRSGSLEGKGLPKMRRYRSQ
jgi:hypothetical protein